MPEAASELHDLVRQALDQDVRPYLQSHGGDVDVVSIGSGTSGGEVTVKLIGACRHCELRMVTFAATVRAKLIALPGVGAVACENLTLSSARLDTIARFFH